MARSQTTSRLRCRCCVGILCSSPSKQKLLHSSPRHFCPQQGANGALPWRPCRWSRHSPAVLTATCEGNRVLACLFLEPCTLVQGRWRRHSGELPPRMSGSPEFSACCVEGVPGQTCPLCPSSEPPPQRPQPQPQRRRQQQPQPQPPTTNHQTNRAELFKGVWGGWRRAEVFSSDCV